MKLTTYLIILACFLLFSCGSSQYKILNIKNGTIDLVDYNANRDGIVKIFGEVGYYPGQLLTINQIYSGDYNPLMVKFPNKLSDQLPNKDAKGYGTYHFKIRLPVDENSYALYIQGIFSSYRLYIGDRLEDKVGVVGTDEERQTPMVRPEIINLHLDEGFNDVLIQVANFHENQAQISYPLQIGDVHSLYRNNYITYGYDFSFSFLYVIIFASFILLFIFHHNNNYLVFAGFCFVLAYRFLIKNSKFLLELVDSHWEFFYKSESVTYYLTSSIIPILLIGIFKVPKARFIIGTIIIVALLASVFTFAAPISFSSPFAYLYHYYSIGLVIFSLFITLIFHAIKKGAKQMVLIAGVAMYSACFLYDVIMSIVYYKESYFYNWGLAILTLCMTFAFIKLQFFSEKKLSYKSLLWMKK